jgi:hypothetical protein
MPFWRILHRKIRYSASFQHFLCLQLELSRTSTPMLLGKDSLNEDRNYIKPPMPISPVCLTKSSRLIEKGEEVWLENLWWWHYEPLCCIAHFTSIIAFLIVCTRSHQGYQYEVHVWMIEREFMDYLESPTPFQGFDIPILNSAEPRQRLFQANNWLFLGLFNDCWR